MALLLVLALPATADHKIENCRTQEKQCCTDCKVDYFVAKCQCLLEGTHMKFFARMNQWVFMLGFVGLPSIVCCLLYAYWKIAAINEIANRGKEERRGKAVDFDNEELHRKKDKAIDLGEDVSLEKKELEMEEKLDEPLREDE